MKTNKEIYEAPIYFTKAQKEIWQETISQMEEAGIFKEGDLRTIEIYCIQVSIFREAMSQVNRDGVINKYTSQNKITNIVKSPALAVAEKASAQMLKYANSLGLTPAAWKRLDVKKEDADLDGF